MSIHHDNRSGLQLPSKQISQGRANLRIGVFLPTWIGDACMATPTLRSLRNSFSSAQIVGIMRPVIRDLLGAGDDGACDWFDEVIVFEKSKRLSRLGLIPNLRRASLDVVFLLTNSLWSAAIARLGGARTIVGYDRDARGWLLTERVPVPSEGKRRTPISAVDYYLELAHRMGCDVGDRQMQLTVSETERQAGVQLWHQIGFSEHQPTAVINSNSATDQLRIWPEGKVRELAVRLATEMGYQVLLHCGPQEREIANRIAAESNHPRIASMGRTSKLPIGLTKAVLAKADIVLTSDSGPRHVAVALGRQVVTLFGPTDIAWTTTYNQPEIALSQALECRPCYQKHCSMKHHRCMQDLSVDRVFEAIQKTKVYFHKVA